MLDDDDRIPQITQSPKRAEQSLIVALMETDARFVEHIENAGKPRPDLRGKSDALSLSA